MGKSATTLDIREPPRFIWSLNNKVITKVPNPNWALMQPLPLMLPLVLRNEEMNNPCNPQCCSFTSRSTKHVDLLHATLHRNYEIHVDNWDTNAQFQTMRPMPLSTECGLTPMPLRVLCYSCDISGTHMSKARLPYRGKVWLPISAGRYTTRCSDPVFAKPPNLTSL